MADKPDTETHDCESVITQHVQLAALRVSVPSVPPVSASEACIEHQPVYSHFPPHPCKKPRQPQNERSIQARNLPARLPHLTTAMAVAKRDKLLQAELSWAGQLYTPDIIGLRTISPTTVVWQHG